MIVTSNRALEEWQPLFGDELLASAAKDHLLHHANLIVIEGHSFRNPPDAKSARRSTSKWSRLVDPRALPPCALPAPLRCRPLNSSRIGDPTLSVIAPPHRSPESIANTELVGPFGRIRGRPAYPILDTRFLPATRVTSAGERVGVPLKSMCST